MPEKALKGQKMKECVREEEKSSPKITENEKGWAARKFVWRRDEVLDSYGCLEGWKTDLKKHLIWNFCLFGASEE